MDTQYIRHPGCSYTMTVKAQRIERGSNGKDYEWAKVYCKYHDVTIEIEVPQADEDAG